MNVEARTRRPWGLIAKAGLKGLAKSLALSAVLVGPGLLLMAESRLIGMVWVMVGSFVMMAWSYRRPWRMMWITCLIPPAASLLAWMIQLAFLGGEPPVALFLLTAGLGLLVGFYRGGAHEVYEKEGVVYARRTVGYLAAWLIAYAFTQLFAALGNEGLAKVGRVGGIFTTAMLAAVSLVLLWKYRRVKRERAGRGGSARAVRVTAWLLVLGTFAGVAWADLPGASEIVDRLVTRGDIPISAHRLDVQYGSNHGGSAQRFFLYTWNVGSAPVQKVNEAHVLVEVERYASARNCEAAGRNTLAVAEGRRSSGPAARIAGPASRSEVQRLSYGSLSLGWRNTYARHRNNSSYTAVAFSGRWHVLVTVGDGRPRMQTFGKQLSNERHKVIALKVLDAAYRNLRGLGLGGEGASGFVPFVGGGASSVSEREAAEVAALIGLILVAAGVAVGVANSIASAVAGELVRAGERAAQDVGSPPLGPGEALDRAQADIRAAELESERADRARERARVRREQDRQQKKDWDDYRRRARERDEAERAREAQARADHEARMQEAEREEILLTGEQLDGTQGWDDTTVGWWTNLLNDWAVGAGQEILDLPNQAVDAARSVWATVTDGENIEIARDTLEGIKNDILGVATLDGQSIARVTGHVWDAGTGVGKVAGTLIGIAAQDPVGSAVGFGKAILGVDNWQKAIDGDRPLLERMGRALWGAVDTGGVMWGVGSGLRKAGTRLIGGAAGATDVVVDVGKGAAAGMRAADGTMDGARALDKAGEAAATLDKSSEVGRALEKSEDLAKTGRGRWDMARDPEGYIRDLPEGAIIDQNLLDGAGYSGEQMDALRKLAKEKNVIIRARTTNMDSMAKIRDGVAVPKPLTIKPKTIGELDVYLGANPADKGLVGHFYPRMPVEANLPPGLRDKIMKRYWERVTGFKDCDAGIQKLISKGEIVVVDGKVHKVMQSGRPMPFAGDIDAVAFLRPGKPPTPLTGAEYVEMRKAWIQSAARGQHGAEYNVVADLLEGTLPSDPLYHQKLAKAEELHGKLSGAYIEGKNIAVDMHPNGVFRRAPHYQEGIPMVETYRPPAGG